VERHLPGVQQRHLGSLVVTRQPHACNGQALQLSNAGFHSPLAIAEKNLASLSCILRGQQYRVLPTYPSCSQCQTSPLSSPRPSSSRSLRQKRKANALHPLFHWNWESSSQTERCTDADALKDQKWYMVSQG